MPQVINNLDLKKNEIQNVVLQPLSTPPSNPKLGQKYFNINDKNEYRWNGTAWVTYQAPLSTTTASTISIPNGIVKGDGSTLTAATAGTDYQAPLPSQAGNSGKYLTTNGSALSWASPPGAPVTSVNTKTGDVVLTAADVGAATSSDISTAINALDGSITGTAGAGKTFTAFSQTNGKVTATFGDISITKSQISDFPTIPGGSSTSPKMDGTATVGTETTWAHGDHIHPSDTNKQDKITASGILKGNGSGTITAATAGTDYQAPLTAGTDYQTPLTAGTDYQTPITFDGTYSTSNKAATVSTVTNAINALDGGTIGTGSASKTITSLSQTNGNVSATFGDISITKSQISDFPTIPSPADATPLMDGTAAIGSSTDYAREDHVHPSDTSKISTSAIGVANGVAPLNASSQIDPSYLPSYVDDVIEGYYNSTDGKFYEEDTYTTEITPEAGKIYIDLSTNKSYRWGGTTYVEMPTGSTVSVTQGLSSGTTVGTITIDGTTTTLYAPEDTDTKVTQTKATYSSYTYWRAVPVGTLSSSTPTGAFGTSTTTDREYSFDNLRFWPQYGWLRTHVFNPAPTAANTTASYNNMTSDSINNIYFRINATAYNNGDTVMTLYSNGTDMQVRPGGQYDDKVDLGKSTVRWKDLYLSGEIYAENSVKLLPTVTASDNGKILAVVDGAWSLVSITDLLTIYNGETS